MLDVHFPTTDGRTLILSRYTELTADQKLLARQLKLDLPPQKPGKSSLNCDHGAHQHTRLDRVAQPQKIALVMSARAATIDRPIALNVMVGGTALIRAPRSLAPPC
jgi:hypothetical protein